MRQKIIGASLLLIGVSISIVGCGFVIPKRESKIVLEEDVRDQLSKTKQSSVEVQVLDLKLKEKEFFKPSFYHQGQIYGEVGKGFGIIESDEPTEEYPLKGIMKEYLYTLDEQDVPIKTNKKIVVYPYDIKVVGKKVWEKNTPIFRVDYANENEPKVDDKLTQIAEKYSLSDNAECREYNIDDQTKYLIIKNYSFTESGARLSFYNLNTNRVYENKEEVINEYDIIYIPTLKSFVYMDENFKFYKINFKRNTYECEEYIDFSQFMATGEGESRVSVILMSEEDVLIIQNQYINESEHHLVMETSTMNQFNFKTNEVKQIFKAEPNQHMYATYVGEVVGQEGKIVVMDDFKMSEKFLQPMRRSFKSLVGDELISLYEEDIQEEGLTLQSEVQVKVSDKSSEMFLVKELTNIENHLHTTQNMIYKKYIFK